MYNSRPQVGSGNSTAALKKEAAASMHKLVIGSARFPVAFPNSEIRTKTVVNVRSRSDFKRFYTTGDVFIVRKSASCEI